jgi:hypothetical protein
VIATVEKEKPPVVSRAQKYKQSSQMRPPKSLSLKPPNSAIPSPSSPLLGLDRIYHLPQRVLLRGICQGGDQRNVTRKPGNTSAYRQLSAVSSPPLGSAAARRKSTLQTRTSSAAAPRRPFLCSACRGLRGWGRGGSLRTREACFGCWIRVLRGG